MKVYTVILYNCKAEFLTEFVDAPWFLLLIELIGHRHPECACKDSISEIRSTEIGLACPLIEKCDGVSFVLGFPRPIGIRCSRWINTVSDVDHCLHSTDSSQFFTLRKKLAHLPVEGVLPVPSVS